MNATEENNRSSNVAKISLLFNIYEDDINAVLCGLNLAKVFNLSGGVSLKLNYKFNSNLNLVVGAYHTNFDTFFVYLGGMFHYEYGIVQLAWSLGSDKSVKFALSLGFYIGEVGDDEFLVEKAWDCNLSQRSVSRNDFDKQQRYPEILNSHYVGVKFFEEDPSSHVLSEMEGESEIKYEDEAVTLDIAPFGKPRAGKKKNNDNLLRSLYSYQESPATTHKLESLHSYEESSPKMFLSNEEVPLLSYPASSAPLKTDQTRQFALISSRDCKTIGTSTENDILYKTTGTSTDSENIVYKTIGISTEDVISPQVSATHDIDEMQVSSEPNEEEYPILGQGSGFVAAPSRLINFNETQRQVPILEPVQGVPLKSALITDQLRGQEYHIPNNGQMYWEHSVEPLGIDNRPKKVTFNIPEESALPHPNLGAYNSCYGQREPSFDRSRLHVLHPNVTKEMRKIPNEEGINVLGITQDPYCFPSQVNFTVREKDRSVDPPIQFPIARRDEVDNIDLIGQRDPLSTVNLVPMINEIKVILDYLLNNTQRSAEEKNRDQTQLISFLERSFGWLGEIIKKNGEGSNNDLRELLRKYEEDFCSERQKLNYDLKIFVDDFFKNLNLQLSKLRAPLEVVSRVVPSEPNISIELKKILDEFLNNFHTVRSLDPIGQNNNVRRNFNGEILHLVDPGEVDNINLIGHSTDKLKDIQAILNQLLNEQRRLSNDLNCQKNSNDQEFSLLLAKLFNRIEEIIKRNSEDSDNEIRELLKINVEKYDSKQRWLLNELSEIKKKIDFVSANSSIGEMGKVLDRILYELSVLNRVERKRASSVDSVRGRRHAKAPFISYKREDMRPVGPNLNSEELKSDDLFRQTSYKKRRRASSFDVILRGDEDGVNPAVLRRWTQDDTYDLDEFTECDSISDSLKKSRKNRLDSCFSYKNESINSIRSRFLEEDPANLVQQRALGQEGELMFAKASNTASNTNLPQERCLFQDSDVSSIATAYVEATETDVSNEEFQSLYDDDPMYESSSLLVERLRRLQGVQQELTEVSEQESNEIREISQGLSSVSDDATRQDGLQVFTNSNLQSIFPLSDAPFVTYSELSEQELMVVMDESQNFIDLTANQVGQATFNAASNGIISLVERECEIRQQLQQVSGLEREQRFRECINDVNSVVDSKVREDRTDFKAQLENQGEARVLSIDYTVSSDLVQSAKLSANEEMNMDVTSATCSNVDVQTISEDTVTLLSSEQVQEEEDVKERVEVQQILNNSSVQDETSLFHVEEDGSFFENDKNSLDLASLFDHPSVNSMKIDVFNDSIDRSGGPTDSHAEFTYPSNNMASLRSIDMLCINNHLHDLVAQQVQVRETNELNTKQQEERAKKDIELIQAEERAKRNSISRIEREIFIDLKALQSVEVANLTAEVVSREVIPEELETSFSLQRIDCAQNIAAEDDSIQGWLAEIHPISSERSMAEILNSSNVLANNDETRLVIMNMFNGEMQRNTGLNESISSRRESDETGLNESIVSEIRTMSANFDFIESESVSSDGFGCVHEEIMQRILLMTEEEFIQRNELMIAAAENREEIIINRNLELQLMIAATRNVDRIHHFQRYTDRFDYLKIDGSDDEIDKSDVSSDKSRDDSFIPCLLLPVNDKKSEIDDGMPKTRRPRDVQKRPNFISLSEEDSVVIETFSNTETDFSYYDRSPAERSVSQLLGSESPTPAHHFPEPVLDAVRRNAANTTFQTEYSIQKEVLEDSEINNYEIQGKTLKEVFKEIMENFIEKFYEKIKLKRIKKEKSIMKIVQALSKITETIQSEINHVSKLQFYKQITKRTNESTMYYSYLNECYPPLTPKNGFNGLKNESQDKFYSLCYLVADIDASLAAEMFLTYFEAISGPVKKKIIGAKVEDRKKNEKEKGIDKKMLEIICQIICDKEYKILGNLANLSVLDDSTKDFGKKSGLLKKQHEQYEFYEGKDKKEYVGKQSIIKYVKIYCDKIMIDNERIEGQTIIPSGHHQLLIDLHKIFKILDSVFTNESESRFNQKQCALLNESHLGEYVEFLENCSSNMSTLRTCFQSLLKKIIEKSVVITHKKKQVLLNKNLTILLNTMTILAPITTTSQIACRSIQKTIKGKIVEEKMYEFLFTK